MTSKLVHPFSRRINQKGFTLLETLIALAIMMIAFASILMTQSSAINSSMKSKQTNTVAMLARRKMAEVELELENKSFQEIREETSFEAFPEPYQDFAWKRVIKEVKFPNLANLSAAGGASDDSASGAEAESQQQSNAAVQGELERITRLVTKFLSDSIREVTLTISWKKGTGQQTFDLSMYWVDLDKEFSLNE